MRGFDRVLREFKESIDTSIALTDLNIVVMGPSLSESSPAATLRKKLIAAAKEYGATIQPEHRGLSRAARTKLKDASNLAVLEVHLVNVSDLVVIIPSSAGSLAELGLFGVATKCQSKLIILVDKTHPRRGSFISDGPIAAAKQAGAQVKYVDYTDMDGCWALVQKRAEAIRGDKALKMAMGT